MSLQSGLWKWKYTSSKMHSTKLCDWLSCAEPESIFLQISYFLCYFSGPDSLGYHIEPIYGYNEAEDRISPKGNPWNAPIPLDVKVAIKSIYAAGVTKPREIMKSLAESGIEEGSFHIDQLYNYLKNMRKQMGVKKMSRGSLGGLEMWNWDQISVE